MQLKLINGIDKPLTKLSENQKLRFIKKLQEKHYTEDVKYGIILSLLMLGYEVED